VRVSGSVMPLMRWPLWAKVRLRPAGSVTADGRPSAYERLTVLPLRSAMAVSRPSAENVRVT